MTNDVSISTRAVAHPASLLTLTCVVLAGMVDSAGCATQPTGSSESQWISLFNGKDLTGWRVKITGYDLDDNFGDTFRVEDGLLKVSYDQYERFNGNFGHLFYETPFSCYRMRVEYRFVGSQAPGGEAWALRNSGIMFHCQPPETMGKDQDFPVSIEAQILGGDGTHERPTANVCTPGTHIVMDDQLITRHCTNSHSKTYPGDQWVRMEIEVHGNGKIKHFVNGELVLEYERPQFDDSDPDTQKLVKSKNMMLSEGYVALQSESHPIEFRKVELMPLEQ